VALSTIKKTSASRKSKAAQIAKAIEKYIKKIKLIQDSGGFSLSRYVAMG
jgi:hypothetical protein